MSISNLTVTFGFGQPWEGVLMPNATTAGVVSRLNATIQSCGLIREPVNGIIPANSKVIFFMSPAVSPTTNSFAGLSDTLYAIFQSLPLSVNAFFINFPGPVPPPDAQTTVVSFGSGCTDQVTYVRSRLVNQQGQPGAQDGSTVEFDFAGNATYLNRGCNAPFEPVSAAWSAPSTICASSGPVQLADYVTGTPGGVFSGEGISGSDSTGRRRAELGRLALISHN